MSTVRFRYGFHPEGFDPLLALRSPQPATAAQRPSPTAIRQQDGTLPSTVLDTRRALGVPQPSPLPVARSERAGPRQRAGWGKFLWASVVLLSTGVAGTVWAMSEDSTTGPAEAPVLAFAPPTVIEPEMMPSTEPLAVVTVDAEPVSRTAAQPPAASPPSSPVPRTPASPPATSDPPPVSPVPPALPSVSLPPAVVWTPVLTPAPEAASKPPVVTEDTSVRRPTVVVRPEVKPSIKAPPTAQPRTPAAKPKVRPAVRGTAGKIARVAR